MSDYISRKAAIKALDDPHVERYYGDVDPESVINVIKQIPAADVREVVYGEWIVSRTDFGWNGAEFPTHCKCSRCGREVPYQDKDNFCPNCGADMREEGEK